MKGRKKRKRTKHQSVRLTREERRAMAGVLHNACVIDGKKVKIMERGGDIMLFKEKIKHPIVDLIMTISTGGLWLIPMIIVDMHRYYSK